MRNFFYDLEDVAKALDAGAPPEASRILAHWNGERGNAADEIFAGEIESLLRAGEIADARHRIHKYLNPKFSSVASSKYAYDKAMQCA